QVDDDGVEVGELLVRGTLIGVVRAVERRNMEASGGVGLGSEGRCVVRAEDAVLGREDGGELCTGDDCGEIGCEDVDGAAAVRVEARLVGENAEVKRVVVL